MSTFPETSLFFLSQSNLPPPPWNLAGIFLVLALVGGAFHYASPARLTRVLVSALADVENKHLAGAENGALPAEVDVAERLAVLQLEVSFLRETSLRSPLSPLSAFYDTFNIRRSVAVLRYLHEVRGLGTIIEISDEIQLREIASESCCQCSLANCANISLRRRDTRSL